MTDQEQKEPEQNEHNPVQEGCKLVLKATWDKYGLHFSQEEKNILNRNLGGETVCPPGVGVLVNEETKPILDKLEVLSKEDAVKA